MRVVFDCNIFLQALASPDGPAGRCVQLAIEGKVSLFLSPAVLEELRDVASRPRVIAKLGLVADRVEQFLEAVEIAATVLTDFPETFAYRRDPDDAHYVNLAIAAGANLIVSRDRDLLGLMDPAKPESAKFRQRFPLLRIQEPVAFLRDIQESP
jgi:putative PIN family toxin of toxin-antitoxin system